MSHDNVVCFKSVTFSYGDKVIVKDADFCIGSNKSICVVGPNGGGKTTLIKLMLGLLKPTSGGITVLGEEPGQARLNIGYLPQHLHYDLSFPASVMDVVLMGRLGRGIMGSYSKQDKAAAEKALEAMGMSDCVKQQFSELSGGQRQRILIARALACEPRLLLLDEPTANVDPSAEEALLKLLHILDKEMTVILVSHNLDFVSSYVDEVLCVHQHVHLHPTAKVTSDGLDAIVGEGLKLIRHDMNIEKHDHK